MDKFRTLEIFIAVAQAEGFAAGARKCMLSAPVATKAISELEASLGVRLLNRTTRQVSLTDAGHRYLVDARRIVEELKEADSSVIGLHGKPTGTLSVTAPALFGRLFVTPVMVEYLKQNPQMKATLLFQDRIVNLAEDGIDLAVRIGHLPDSGLNAIPLGHVKRIVVGSPDYLRRNGTPKQPKDLLHHKLIAPVQLNPVQDWRFGKADKQASVRLEPVLTTTTNDAAIEAAVMGFGLTRILSYQVANEIEQGRLKVCLSKFEPDPLPVQIVHREGRTSTAKTRAFIDLAKAMLSTSLAKVN
jgi:DNA-binding transcriptional LysR family regulator